jgi:beta-mannanase
VSSILVPSCGAWLGASIPSRDGNFNWSKGIAEYEGVAQNVPDILHFYKNGNQTFPSKSELAVAERNGKQRSLLLYNWKPSGNLTWRQVANGAADSQIARMASGVKKYPHKLFLNIYHEPEDQVKSSSSSGMTTADYKAMYRHVVDELNSQGVNNAVYVWNVMGYYGWADYLDGLYPGDAYVDWICYDPYAKDNRQDNLADIVNRVKSNLNWPGFYTWATRKAPGKPLMLCEWGIDVNSNNNPASILDGDPAQQMKNFPMLKAFVYWNSIDKVNARIDNTSTKGKAFGNAYRQFANRPFFNQTSTNKAP